MALRLGPTNWPALPSNDADYAAIEELHRGSGKLPEITDSDLKASCFFAIAPDVLFENYEQLVCDGINVGGPLSKHLGLSDGASFKQNLVQGRVGLAIMFEEGRPCSPVLRKIRCPFFATGFRDIRTHRRLLDRRW